MAHMDVFRQRAFHMVEMSAAVQRAPYKPNFLGSLNLFTTKRVRTPTVSVEDKGGVLSLIQTSERGAPISEGEREKRNLRDFRTVRIARGHTLYAHEIDGIRAFGTDSELQMVQNEVAEIMSGETGLRAAVDLTHENMRLGAIQGVVVDADGSTLWNWFDAFGIQQPGEIDFDLDAANPQSGAVRTKCNQVVRSMQRAAQGAWNPQTSVVGLCGDAFFDQLTSHAEVRSTYLNQQEAADLRGAVGRVFSSFTYGVEAVRDFFFAQRNHFDPLDRAAESLAAQTRARGGAMAPWLAQRLRERHDVRVTQADATGIGGKRQYDAASRTLTLSPLLAPAQQAFQMATQLAFLEMADTLSALTGDAPFDADAPARRLARIGLANYFAGALLLPYGEYLEAADRLRHDIDLLALRFGVGFETACHRLSTLQRPGAPGVPFFFVRVDRAGNISKRQSATHFHFSRTGGTCPLWAVYEAFSQPGRILPQLARMPDGRTSLWVARTVAGGSRGWGAPRQTFAIGLGCDIRHAPRLVYADGLDLQDPARATPIGMGCKVCERRDCAQRAFPFVGQPLKVDEQRTEFIPYGCS